MKKFKALIIEDEQPARDLLRLFLNEYPEIELIDECSDGFDGAKAISLHKPDLVFLDIQMPRINGFEMLELIDTEQLPLIIFTTAFDQFALKAFEFNALDYLLKPIALPRFKQAVDKALASLKAGQSDTRPISKLIETGMGTGTYIDRIVLKSGEGFHVILQEDIFCIEAHDDYVIIATSNEEYLKKKTLKFYEENLDPSLFLRVHRSFLVQINAIKKIEPYSKDAFIGILKNGRKISISKSGYSELRKSFNS
jgi:two-component system LytT family response regulator